MRNTLKGRKQNKKVCLRVLGCLLFFIFSQSAFGWSVILRRPPPEQLAMEHLWKVDVRNQDDEPVCIRLKVEVKEQNEGLVFQGVSNDITIPGKSTKRITSRDITEVKETRYKPEYEERIKRSGKFPAGSYEICVYVLRCKDNFLLAKNCIFHRVTQPCPPRLISPSNGGTVVKRRPLFLWTAPIPLLAGLRVTYRFKVCEIYGSQNPYEAINNIPHYENKNLISTSLQYPVAGKAFKDRKRYCWQVQAKDKDGFPIGGNDGKSEIWSFTYTTAIPEREGTLKWKFKTEGAITAEPAMDEERNICIGSQDSCLYSISPDGILRWKFKTGGGIETSPSIGDDNIIYVGSQDGYLYAINPDGELKWKSKIGGRIAPFIQAEDETDEELRARAKPALRRITSLAIGEDGTVYVGSQDGCLYAIDGKKNVSRKFKTEESISSLAIGKDNTIFVGSQDGCLYAIDPPGNLKWRYQTQGAVGSAIIGRDGVVYVGSEDNCLYAINPEGTLRWKFKTGSGVGSPVVGEDVIYLGSQDGYLYAIDLLGNLKWKRKTGAGIESSPVIGEKILCVGSQDSCLYAIEIGGPPKWKYKAEGRITSPIISPDGVIYFGSEDGYLYAIRGSGGLAPTPWPVAGHDLRHTGRANNFDIRR